MERVVRERMTTEDVDTITPQTIINIRPVVAALKEFFGSSQLSQFMDQTNSLAGPHPPAPPLGARRRRPDPRARADRGARRAPDPLRPHVPDRDAGGPEHRPDRLARLVRDGLRVRLRPDAVPGGQGRQGHRRDRLPRRRRGGAVHDRAGVRAESTTKTGKFLDEQVLCRSRERRGRDGARRRTSSYMDVSPAQIVSVATALIPFLEHNDANRALMGANMQRQAVPLMIPQAPLVGTGLEYRAAVDTGDVVARRTNAGTVDRRRRRADRRRGARARSDEYPLTKFMRSNQGTLIHQKPIVGARRQGQGGRGARRRLARPTAASSRSARTCWSPSCRGRATTSRTRSSSRSGSSRTTCSPRSTSTSTRSTPARRSSATRRSRATSRTARRSRSRNLDERGVVRIGAEVGSGDLLVGKVTPKGETELTAEEKLIRAIFKEKAREVRDTSLKVPHGEGGKVIDVKTFSPRRRRRPAAGRQRARPRLRREEAQDRRGRQARRPPRQQGRDLEDRPRGGHAVPRGRHARSTSSSTRSACRAG